MPPSSYSTRYWVFPSAVTRLASTRIPCSTVSDQSQPSEEEEDEGRGGEVEVLLGEATGADESKTSDSRVEPSEMAGVTSLDCREAATDPEVLAEG